MVSKYAVGSSIVGALSIDNTPLTLLKTNPRNPFTQQTYVVNLFFAGVANQAEPGVVGRICPS
jgi:hypothetical protein